MTSSPPIRPIRVERRLSHRLWGGQRLAGFLGIDPGVQAENLAESWQVAGECIVADGPYRGRTLGEVGVELGEALLGSGAVARYGTTFPLLAKFIDAAQPLSIQVHPDDDYALSRERDTGYLGKAEAWLILECAPDAHVVRGFRDVVDPERVRAAVADGSVEELLARQPVAPGDIVYNAPGTVHAIGAGILLFEIQQSSDLTYRLYDFGRVDASGSPRELHVDKALEVADLGPAPARTQAGVFLGAGRRLLFECEYFLIEELVTAESPRPTQGAPASQRLTTDPASQRLTTDPASLEILTAVEGNNTVRHAGLAYPLPAGESLTLPAALGEYLLEGSGRVLRCRLPS